MPDTPAAREAIEQIRQLDARSQSSPADTRTPKLPSAVPAPHVLAAGPRTAGDAADEPVSTFIDDLLRRAYLHHVRSFLLFSSGSFEHAETQVRSYLLERVNKDRVSAAYHSQAVSALRFFFETVAGQAKALASLPRPRPDHRLPGVLGKADTRKLIDAVIALIAGILSWPSSETILYVM